jgi:hypothetical protein
VDNTLTHSRKIAGTMLKYFFLLFTLAVVAVVAFAGFRGQHSKLPPIELFPDMDHQAKVKAQKPSDFYADGAATRVPVEGTVPIGYAAPLSKDMDAQAVAEAAGPYKAIQFGNGPDYVNTGRIGDSWGTGMPFEITPAILERGRQRYNISCAVCHGAAGSGNGVTSKYGIVAIANFHDQRLVDMADGEIFNTITHGKNTMLGYGYNIQVPDRWAIIAYIRALQASQLATVADVPADQRAALEAAQ